MSICVSELKTRIHFSRDCHEFDVAKSGIRQKELKELLGIVLEIYLGGKLKMKPGSNFSHVRIYLPNKTYPTDRNATEKEPKGAELSDKANVGLIKSIFRTKRADSKIYQVGLKTQDI